MAVAKLPPFEVEIWMKVKGSGKEYLVGTFEYDVTFNDSNFKEIIEALDEGLQGEINKL